MDLDFLEQLSDLERRFKKFSVAGTSEVLVSGNLKSGLAINIRKEGGEEVSVIGACCFDDGSCVEETLGQCLLDGGTWQPGTCDPNPCVGACTPEIDLLDCNDYIELWTSSTPSSGANGATPNDAWANITGEEPAAFCFPFDPVSTAIISQSEMIYSGIGNYNASYLFGSKKYILSASDTGCGRFHYDINLIESHTGNITLITSGTLNFGFVGDVQQIDGYALGQPPDPTVVGEHSTLRLVVSFVSADCDC